MIENAVTPEELAELQRVPRDVIERSRQETSSSTSTRVSLRITCDRCTNGRSIVPPMPYDADDHGMQGIGAEGERVATTGRLEASKCGIGQCGRDGAGVLVLERIVVAPAEASAGSADCWCSGCARGGVDCEERVHGVIR
jgi:hypothetical protein